MKTNEILGAELWQALLEGESRPSASGPARLGRWFRHGLAVLLCGLMILVPMGQGTMMAQEQVAAPAPGPAPDNSAQPQPLSNDQLNQLVAPLALYPDALVAQILAAATYPTQVVEANRWRQGQGNASSEQIAAGADKQNWDPSVKALAAFPSVLAQMDRNLQWTTDLGNAYYNQPQDVMNSVQAMRQKAYDAGNLRSTQQQTVTVQPGQPIVIAPANPSVVYVPAYDPWAVYGAPVVVYPGYYYAPPPGIFWGGLAIGFGIGIGIGFWGGYGWGWHHWGMGWHDHSVFYGGNHYYSHSTTVINHGFGRPGGPGAGVGARGAYSRPGGAAGFHGGANRPGGSGNFGRGAGSNVARPGGGFHPNTANSGHPSGGSFNRPGTGGNTNHPSIGGNNATSHGSTPGIHGQSTPSNSGHAGGASNSGGGHVGGGGHAGGGHASGGGGHSGHK